ncbi:MAG: ammonium transporter [Candidatus Lokiarchaeota archaeon]|nr:ammonium transporter [Candidatus Lokiarchaeota archaeon]
MVIDAGTTAWILVCAAMVMIMTPGLALFYGGLTRKKNLLSTMMMSFVAIVVITIQWIIIGYALAFGDSVGGFIGDLRYFGLIGILPETESTYAAGIPAYAFILFQLMFAIITAAIVSSAFVERMKFSAYIIFLILWTTLVYDPIAHWVWGSGGFLGSKLGALDFAGGTVVHIASGTAALAGALVLGKRKGFQEHDMLPNNVPYVLIGTALLWFGWFAFNAGSALAANGTAANAFMVTFVSSCAGGFVWLCLSWSKGKPSPIGLASGVLAGLVGITPAAGFVGPLEALIIGGVAAAIGFYMIELRLKKLKIDESLDAWAVHCMGGIWGAIATGIFASAWVTAGGASGLIYGNVYQFLVQLAAVGITFAYSFGLTFIILKIMDLTMGIRVEEKAEYLGLDLAEHGEKAYA